jgi:hypothetical protein
MRRGGKRDKADAWRRRLQVGLPWPAEIPEQPFAQP